jgi:Protein of unknown function (DUF2844)
LVSLTRMTCAALALMIAASPLVAHAELGGRYATVLADGAHMKAQVRSLPATNYTLHTLDLANGGEVRQYAAADGTVFAVAWNGPGRPDLRQLLGTHFETVQTDNAPARGRFRRHPLAVQRTDFVMRTGGHSGAFFGVAYLPRALPAGVSEGDIR